MIQAIDEYPVCPPKDLLLHNRTDRFDTDDQRKWWDALVRLSDVLSLTMEGAVEKTTGKYKKMLFTEFLDRLYHVVTVERMCGQGFIFDDFVQIAKFSIPALKHIVSMPSTRIVKNSEKVHISQLHQTGSKTMQWMSKRPGRSALEKIAPENKVLTSVTHFTTDTKENQESIYLYDILYDIIRERLKENNCLSCEHAEECGIPTKDIRDLMALHNKIRNGDMAEVKAMKQPMQNNKLMCDKYYKMVWDAVQHLSRIEEKLNQDWVCLRDRYYQLAFWTVLSIILHDTDSAILDFYGVLSDKGGKLSFDIDQGTTSGDGAALENNINIYPVTRSWEPVCLYQNGTMVELFDIAADKGLWYFDTAVILDELYKPEEKKCHI